MYSVTRKGAFYANMLINVFSVRHEMSTYLHIWKFAESRSDGFLRPENHRATNRNLHMLHELVRGQDKNAETSNRSAGA